MEFSQIGPDLLDMMMLVLKVKIIYSHCINYTPHSEIRVERNSIIQTEADTYFGLYCNTLVRLLARKKAQLLVMNESALNKRCSEVETSGGCVACY